MSQPAASDRRPVTGDPEVDRVLADFAAATGAPDATTGTAVTAAAQAHRRLQARLSDTS